MSVRELMAYPDLVTRLDQERRCPMPIRFLSAAPRPCSQPARWKVQGQPESTCGLHATRALQRLLAEIGPI